MNWRENEQGLGMLFAIGAYLLWGLLPLYWKLLASVSAEEVLAHRIIWSLVFMIVILYFSHKLGSSISDIKVLIKQPKKLLAVLLASGLISLNWFVYIWAVGNERVIETSLGYYINPLVNVLLGILILKEKLSLWQLVAVVLAAIGVLNMTMQFEGIPWVALTLACSFAFYGLFKKMANLGALTGLTMETLLIAPFAVVFISMLTLNGTSTANFEATEILLLIGAGIATAVPLLLFAAGARRITLSLIGFFQYIAPTITLIIGIFLFKEPFTASHLNAFLFIWAALVIFSFAKTRAFLHLERKILLKIKPKPLEKGRPL